MNLKAMKTETIEAMLDALPVDVSFVDETDTVTYFNTPKLEPRIFPRTKMDIGRKVQNCHPPQSVDKVNKILDGFKKGEMKQAPFWIDFRGKKIYINYFPVTGENGEYLGCLEVTQDITEIQKITGEKRL